MHKIVNAYSFIILAADLSSSSQLLWYESVCIFFTKFRELDLQIQGQIGHVIPVYMLVLNYLLLLLFQITVIFWMEHHCRFTLWHFLVFVRAKWLWRLLGYVTFISSNNATVRNTHTVTHSICILILTHRMVMGTAIKEQVVWVPIGAWGSPDSIDARSGPRWSLRVSHVFKAWRATAGDGPWNFHFWKFHKFMKYFKASFLKISVKVIQRKQIFKY